MSFQRYTAATTRTDISNVQRYTAATTRVDCEAVKRYNGSAWVDVWTNNFWIFKQGSGLISGSLTPKIYSYNTNNYASYSVDANYITATITCTKYLGSGSCSAALYTPLIDVTDFSKLYFTSTGLSTTGEFTSQEIQAGLTSQNTSNYLSNAAKLVYAGTNGQMSIDISDLSGSYYFALRLQAYPNQINTTATIKWTNIYMK